MQSTFSFTVLFFVIIFNAVKNLPNNKLATVGTCDYKI